MKKNDITQLVTRCLAEDIGNGDITAELIPKNQQARAQIITRQPAILCGQPYVDEVYRQLGDQVKLDWHTAEGGACSAQQILCEIQGNARCLLSGERCALNFLQTLSATATLTHQFAQAISATKAIILDTRKTIPGLRQAQKYAVYCGGGQNHRMGLYDAYLIKENHIMACGSIAAAIQQARQLHPNKKIEVEVENFSELEQALVHHADIILLDNFSIEELCEAVKINAGRAKLEASGNVSFETVKLIAETGVDYISIGALTKNIAAIDLSLRLI